MIFYSDHRMLLVSTNFLASKSITTVTSTQKRMSSFLIPGKRSLDPSLEMTTTPPLCSDYTLSTVLLKLVNAPKSNYTLYSYVYRANAVRTTLMFCFLNGQNFWALDDTSMKLTTGGPELLGNAGFETASWTYWTSYNSVYYGSGIGLARAECSPRTGSRFYFDLQYTRGDGIYQNITTVIGQNYTVSFYLANPQGGNISVAVVSIGS